MAENIQGLRPKDNKTATGPRNLPPESHSASLAAKCKLLCNGKERFKTSHRERLHVQLKRSVLRTGLLDLDGIWSLCRWRIWDNPFSSSALGWEMCLQRVTTGSSWPVLSHNTQRQPGGWTAFHTTWKCLIVHLLHNERFTYCADKINPNPEWLKLPFITVPLSVKL